MRQDTADQPHRDRHCHGGARPWTEPRTDGGVEPDADEPDDESPRDEEDGAGRSDSQIEAAGAELGLELRAEQPSREAAFHHIDQRARCNRSSDDALPVHSDRTTRSRFSIRRH